MGLTTEVKLGAFVLATSVAFAFLILTFGEIPIFEPEKKTYTVYFDDVSGLSVGAEVRVSGIRAGKVEDIVLEGNRVKVLFSVEEKFTIFKDASAYIGTLGLMGDKFLAINPGTPALGELAEGEEIKSAEGVADGKGKQGESESSPCPDEHPDPESQQNTALGYCLGGAPL